MNIEESAMTNNHFDNSKINNNDQNFGNYFRCLKIKNFYVFNIGPQWYILMVITLLISAFGIGVLSLIDKKKHPTLHLVYSIIYGLSVFVNVLMFISDPGIASKKNVNWDEEKSISFLCDICKTLPNEDIEHCSICNVCIEQFDHHCVVLGKCIGGKNLFIFYMYVGFIPALLWGTIICLCLISE